MAAPRLCKIEDCGKPVDREGLCSAHYYRLLQYGTPLGGRAVRGSVRSWIRAHIDYKGDDCLHWPFARAANGYGSVRIGGKSKNAARYMCALAHGAPKKPGIECAHTCGRGHEGCVNPRHLRWATRKQNASDMVDHGTVQRGPSIKNSKLNEDSVRAIRKLAPTVSRKELGIRFGVSEAAITSVLLRKNWAWVE